MKTSLSIRLHTATWIVAILITVIPFFKGVPAAQMTGNIIATFYWMAVYYLFFTYMAPVYLLNEKIYTFFGVAIVLLAILTFIGYSLLFLSRAIFDGSFDQFYRGYSLPMHLSGFKAMALAGVYGSFFRLIVEYFKK